MKTQCLMWKPILPLILVALIGGTLACQGQVAGPRVWMDIPLDGSSVPAGTPVPVVSHAYARDGIAEIMLSVNGEPYRRSPPAQPDNTLSKTSLDWLPQQAGDYVLQVRAYSKSGEASNPATARVRVLGKGTPTPTLAGKTVTPVATGAPDLAIVSVDAVFVNYKGDVPLCKPRVVYRNAGTVPVPNDYVIQLHINGTPQMGMTRDAGFGAGGTSEAIFNYLFEGSPYIGINLDSTNTVSESDERNNAFAAARLCSGATPVPPISVTPATPTLTPTPTPVTPPPPAACSGTPNIASFTASPSSIQRGQAATLSWGAVSNADSVSIQPDLGGVGTPGSTTVSPGQTTTYTLTANCGKNQATRQVTISVSTPVPPTYTPTATRTRTPTPRDTQGPPAPNLVSPKGSLQCTTNVTLDWKPVSDPSGIKQYIVKWVRNDGPSGGAVTTGTAHSISVACDKSYTWTVQAVDNAGNAGDKSSASFSVQPGLY